MDITAIILAAGLSKRFGENKLLLTISHKTFVEIIIEKILEENFNQIILVAKDLKIIDIAKKYPLEIVINEKRELGQSTSIVAGVKAAKKENALMFFVCDQPFLSSKTIKEIIRNYSENTDKIIVPHFKDKNGSPTIFPCSSRNSLLQLTGDSGGRTIISKSDDVKIINFEYEIEHIDIDSKEDYLRMNNLELSYNGNFYSNIIVIRGGGDLASGVIQKLKRTGFNVLILETEKPSAIRTTVSFSQAVYINETKVEDITSKLTSNLDEIINCIKDGIVPVYIDKDCEILKELKPFCLVDCIIAKKNLGTSKNMAPITIALGPGFEAGKDVDIVIETMRGHNLGRLLFNGFAKKNTGEPGLINGVSKERVIYSPWDGPLKKVRNIGDEVSKGEIIAYIDENPVYATIPGILRGLLPECYMVYEKLKMADIDPRIAEKNNCFTISDKSRSIGGAVLEALLILRRRKNI